MYVHLFILHIQYNKRQASKAIWAYDLYCMFLYVIHVVYISFENIKYVGYIETENIFFFDITPPHALQHIY